MNDSDELDLYTVDLQWMRSRLVDGREEIATAYELVKDNPRVREHLANAVGTFDTMIDRLSRLVPPLEDTEEARTTYMQDLKSRKQKGFIKRWMEK